MMDFSIGKTGSRKQAVKPVGRFVESDSEEEKQDVGEKGGEEALVSVEDLQYCLECHRAFADRSHLQRHRTACHPA